MLFLIDYRLRAKEQSARVAMAEAERVEAHFAVIEVQRERWLEEEKAELERAAYIRRRTARLAAGDGEAFVDRADLGVGNRTVEERVRAFYAFHPKFRDASKNLVRCLLSLSLSLSLSLLHTLSLILPSRTSPPVLCAEHAHSHSPYGSIECLFLVCFLFLSSHCLQDGIFTEWGGQRHLLIEAIKAKYGHDAFDGSDAILLAARTALPIVDFESALAVAASTEGAMERRARADQHSAVHVNRHGSIVVVSPPPPLDSLMEEFVFAPADLPSTCVGATPSALATPQPRSKPPSPTPSSPPEIARQDPSPERGVRADAMIAKAKTAHLYPPSLGPLHYDAPPLHSSPAASSPPSIHVNRHGSVVITATVGARLSPRVLANGEGMLLAVEGDDAVVTSVAAEGNAELGVPAPRRRGTYFGSTTAPAAPSTMRGCLSSQMQSMEPEPEQVRALVISSSPFLRVRFSLGVHAGAHAAPPPFPSFVCRC